MLICKTASERRHPLAKSLRERSARLDNPPVALLRCLVTDRRAGINLLHVIETFQHVEQLLHPGGVVSGCRERSRGGHLYVAHDRHAHFDVDAECRPWADGSLFRPGHTPHAFSARRAIFRTKKINLRLRLRREK